MTSVLDPQYAHEWPPASTASEPVIQNQDSESESDSSSSSDSDDSGSESDSESSDSEDLGSETEYAAKGMAAVQANPTSAVGSEGDSGELVLFGHGTNSGGFSSDDLFGIAAGTRLREMHLEQISDASQSTRESFGFNPTPYPFGSSWSAAQEQSAPPEGNGRSKNRRSSSHEQQTELPQSQPARKRKCEPELQPVARKAPKFMTSKTGGLRTAKEEGAQSELKHHSLQKRKSSRRDSFLSSFSVSESDNSEDSSSEREEGEAFMDTALPEPGTLSATATTSRTHEATLLSPLRQHPHQHQQPMGSRNDAGGVAGGVTGLGQQEPLLHGPGALVVRIPLPLLLRDQQKPKVGFVTLGFFKCGC